MIEVKIIADSVSPEDVRITTMQLKYQRFIHSEFMTHRVFSRNASSSRAIPVAKMIEQVRNDPAMPIHWGKNQPGMQAHEELTGAVLESAQRRWGIASRAAANAAEMLLETGAHKQVVNRILEPFQWIHVVVTATEWDNFFALRDHPDAQPEIRELARQMRHAMNESTPKFLDHWEWHVPYVTDEEYLSLDIEIAKQVSAARCCRVSYLKHDGSTATIEEDVALCERLAGAEPIHASPFEHQASPDMWFDEHDGWSNPHLHGNLRGWIQNRKLIEHRGLA